MKRQEKDIMINESTDIKELKKFDIDLNFGQRWEKYIDELLSGNTKVEVKTERDIWASTGNIAIEYEFRGNKSGIRATESDVWVHNLVKDDEIYCSLLFPVDKLKKLCNNMPNKKTTYGGDNMDSKMVLLNLRDTIDELIKIAGDK